MPSLSCVCVGCKARQAELLTLALLLTVLHSEVLICLPCSVVYSLKASTLDKFYLRKSILYKSTSGGPL